MKDEPAQIKYKEPNTSNYHECCFLSIKLLGLKGFYFERSNHLCWPYLDGKFFSVLLFSSIESKIFMSYMNLNNTLFEKDNIEYDYWISTFGFIHQKTRSMLFTSVQK